MKRIFIAISFSEEVKNSLAELQKKIQPLLTRGRMTNPALFHLTIQFLGELREESVMNLLSDHHHWVASIPHFHLKISKTGYFEKRNKCILWTGVEESLPLHQLAAQIRETLAVLGHGDERPFRPHVTLAREAVFRDQEAVETYNSLMVSAKPVLVDRFQIMESTRDEQGLIYQPLKEINWKS